MAGKYMHNISNTSHVVCLTEERCAQRLRNGGKTLHNNNIERQVIEDDDKVLLSIRVPRGEPLHLCSL